MRRQTDGWRRSFVLSYLALSARLLLALLLLRAAVGEARGFRKPPFGIIGASVCALARWCGNPPRLSWPGSQRPAPRSCSRASAEWPRPRPPLGWPDGGA